MKVLTAGTFDLLHPGHLKLFKTCSLLANFDNFYILVNTDECVSSFKKIQVKEGILVRIKKIRDFFDQNKIANPTILPNSFPEIRLFLECLRPELLIVGSDWASKDYYKQIGVDKEWLEKRDIRLLYCPYTEGISSTQLRRELNE